MIFTMDDLSESIRAKDEVLKLENEFKSYFEVFLNVYSEDMIVCINESYDDILTYSNSGFKSDLVKWLNGRERFTKLGLTPRKQELLIVEILLDNHIFYNEYRSGYINKIIDVDVYINKANILEALTKQTKE